MRGGRFLPRRATRATARPSRSASSGVMGGTFALPRIPSVPKSFLPFISVSEILELELDAHVRGAEKAHGVLEIILLLAADPEALLVDRRLHLELRVLDDLDELLRLVFLDP